MNFFSERERKIIKIIGRSKTTVGKITTKLFKNETFRPFNGEIMVATSIARVIKKCKHYELAWTLSKNRVNGKLIIRREKL